MKAHPNTQGAHRVMTGREWSDTSTSQGTPSVSSHDSNHGTDSPLEAADTLISDIQPPKLREVSQTPKFVAICYSSPRKPIHLPGQHPPPLTPVPKSRFSHEDPCDPMKLTCPCPRWPRPVSTSHPQPLRWVWRWVCDPVSGNEA